MDKPMTDSRLREICAIVLDGGDSPNLDGVTKEELLFFGRVALVAPLDIAVKMKRLEMEISFWRHLCYGFGGAIVISIIIDLLKLAEVI